MPPNSTTYRTYGDYMRSPEGAAAREWWRRRQMPRKQRIAHECYAEWRRQGVSHDEAMSCIREALHLHDTRKRPASAAGHPTALLALSPARTQVRGRQSKPKPTRRKSERPDGESEPPAAIADADALGRLERAFQPLAAGLCQCARPIRARWPSGPGRLHCHKCGKAVAR